jgi:hypothetical protein
MLSAILKDRPEIISDALGWISHVINRCVSFSEAPSKAGLSERYAKMFARAIASTVCLKSLQIQVG